MIFGGDGTLSAGMNGNDGIISAVDAKYTVVVEMVDEIWMGLSCLAYGMDGDVVWLGSIGNR